MIDIIGDPSWKVDYAFGDSISIITYVRSEIDYDYE